MFDEGFDVWFTDVLMQVFVMSLKPTQKSAMTSGTINALVFVRRFRLLQTRKIINLFPVMFSNERNQLRIQYQLSICNNFNYRLLEIRVSQNVARVGGEAH